MKKRLVVGFVSALLGGAVFAVTRRRRKIADVSDVPGAVRAPAEAGLIVESGEVFPA
jgi:hypothetical protein